MGELADIGGDDRQELSEAEFGRRDMKMGKILAELKQLTIDGKIARDMHGVPLFTLLVTYPTKQSAHAAARNLSKRYGEVYEFRAKSDKDGGYLYARFYPVA